MAKARNDSLAAKLGSKLDSAVKAHQADETDYGSFRLPGGVRGVAQLTKCYFAKYKKGDNVGEFYFMAIGTVLEPAEYKGCPTSIGPIACCDTKNRGGKKTALAEHVAEIMNELAKLGGDRDDMDSGASLETVAEALQEAAPTFRFSTRESPGDVKKGWKARVWETWHGIKGLEDYEAPDPEQPVETEEAGEDAEAEEAEAEGEEETSEVDLDNLKKLAKKADKNAKDKESALAISDVAKEHDIDPEEHDNWAEVVAAIEEAIGGAGEEEAEEEAAEEEEAEAEEEEEKAPEEGDLYFYKPKGKPKRIEVEIKAVFASKKTANVVDCTDGKTTYKQVAWSDLHETAK